MAAIEPQVASGLPATARLYELHYPRVLAFCLWRLRNREDAEDAAQTTFLDAHRALARGTVPESEGPWLLGIAQNVCRSRWRADRTRPAAQPLAPDDLSRLAAPETDPYLLGRLRDALARLPEQQRRALVLREFDDLTYVEIAERLGTTEAAVASLVFRARESVAAAFADERPVERRRRASLASVLGWLKSFGLGTGAKVATGLAVGVAGAVTAVPLAQHGSPVRAERPIRVDSPAHVALSRSAAKRAPTAESSRVDESARARRPFVRPPRIASRRSTPLPPATRQPAPQRASAPDEQPAPAAAPPARAPEQPVAPPPATPSATTPALTTPTVQTPTVTTPAATVASVTVPSVTVPAVTVPAVTVPAVTLPRLP